MKKSKITGFLTLFIILILKSISAQPPFNPEFETPYGENSEVGNYIAINGTNIYYETYGHGKPLLLIHGNGGSIINMGYQIEYFSKTHKVVIPDCRGRGKSELGTDSLTYELMTADIDILLDSLNIDSCDIIGWSDGGIIGLLMAMNYPMRTKKVVTMGANIWHDSTAIYPWVIEWIKTTKQKAYDMFLANDSQNDWNLIYQRMDLMDEQPNITLQDLKKVKSPVLVVAGDKDVIREEHSLIIYQNIQNSQLWIIPGGTHFAPIRQPDLFNETVYRFLNAPFTRPDSNF